MSGAVVPGGPGDSGPGGSGPGGSGPGSSGPGGSRPGGSGGRGELRLGRRVFRPEQLLVMAIVNRTPDSFYRPGVTWDPGAALERVHTVVAEGADIVDVGGVPARPGDEVDVAEEIGRTVPFIAAVRDAYPELVISVDTWRHEVGREACAAGADLLNDSWGGWDPQLAEVAAEFGAGIVCSHAGGLPPRTRPFRVAYDDVVQHVLAGTLSLAARAVAAGVDPTRILIDPAHDFGKNTWHSLEVTRRLAELAETGWPVLVSMSNKDFIGETLDVPVDERLAGTLAATAVSAWLGARVFRAHHVPETRHVLSMVSVIRGDIPPARVVRGLA
jgi:dihydropteroate synthase